VEVGGGRSWVFGGVVGGSPRSPSSHPPFTPVFSFPIVPLVSPRGTVISFMPLSVLEKSVVFRETSAFNYEGKPMRQRSWLSGRLMGCAKAKKPHKGQRD